MIYHYLSRIEGLELVKPSIRGGNCLCTLLQRAREKLFGHLGEVISGLYSLSPTSCPSYPITTPPPE